MKPLLIIPPANSLRGYIVGVNQYIDISIRTGIRLSGDIRYIVLTIRQYNVGFENSTFDRRACSLKFKNGLLQKANKFWEYSAKKEYDAAECNLCSNELQHPVGKQIPGITVHHQWHNKFVTKSAKCPTHMMKSIDYKCAMTVLGRFWSFSPKTNCSSNISDIATKRIVSYRIEKNLPNTQP